MEELAVSLGQPRFRGRQLFQWVHGRLETDLGRMTSLPRAFAAQLAELHPVARAEPVRELVSSDGTTRKRLLRLADGQTLEAVLMQAPASAREADRYTVCVSSQVGCALGCTFCVTGQMGFGRQLSPGEIVEQVYHFERELRGLSRNHKGTKSTKGHREGSPEDLGAPSCLRGEIAGHRFVTNVVFMGMGEPLANYEAVMAAVRLLLSPDGFGLGARRITISTAGLVPGIERLAGEGLQLGLAISLHAAGDEVRGRIMPINRRYPVAQLMAAAVGYAAATGRRVSYEYALMQDVNDGAAHAWKLAHLLAGQLCHVNLIPLNRSLDPALKASSPERIAAFRRILEEAGIPCTVRQTRGQDILAACGQLRHRASNE